MLNVILYLLLLICLLINVYLIIPFTMAFCTLGTIMSGGFVSYIGILLIMLVATIMPNLFILPLFLLKDKKVFFINLAIVFTIYFIVCNIYTFSFVSNL